MCLLSLQLKVLTSSLSKDKICLNNYPWNELYSCYSYREESNRGGNFPYFQRRQRKILSMLRTAHAVFVLLRGAMIQLVKSFTVWTLKFMHRKIYRSINPFKITLALGFAPDIMILLGECTNLCISLIIIP